MKNNKSNEICGYSDADWAESFDRKSTTIFLYICRNTKIMSYKDKEKNREYNKMYYAKNKEKELKRFTEYNKSYSKTPMGRAQRQFQQYKHMDKRNGFGNVIDFDARWIVENIYTKKCAHCDETDWHKLGCNRLDNSKPHTMDNVEPCCFHCNCALNGKENGVKNLTYNKQ